MAREAKPCPFYGMPCEYVPMAEKADAAAARIEQLEKALSRISKLRVCPDQEFNANRTNLCLAIEIAEAALPPPPANEEADEQGH